MTEILRPSGDRRGVRYFGRGLKYSDGSKRFVVFDTAAMAGLKSSPAYSIRMTAVSDSNDIDLVVF